MFRAVGTIRFEYRNEGKQFKYDFYNLAGTPHFSFTDKRGRWFGFRRLSTGWKSVFTVEPKWPKDFIEVLYQSLEDEYQVLAEKHGFTTGIS